MSDNMWNLKLDKYEYCIVINALNDLRTELIRQKRNTEPVDEILIKIIDTPPKHNKKERYYCEAR